MFLSNRAAFDDLVLESTAADDEDNDEAVVDEEVKEDASDEGDFVYDRALYDADGLEEDVDFDD